MAAETDIHTAADAHAATSEVAHEGGGGGLPQFRFEYWGGQIVWLILIFVVLYTALSKVFVPRLRGILDTRAKTIADAVEQARKVQADAEAQAKAAQAEVDQARAQARQLAADAKAKAAAEMAKSQAAEDDRLKDQMAQAETRIRELRDAAMTNVGGIATETAQAIVEKLTGEKVAAKDVAAALSQGAA